MIQVIFNLITDKHMFFCFFCKFAWINHPKNPDLSRVAFLRTKTPLPGCFLAPVSHELWDMEIMQWQQQDLMISRKTGRFKGETIQTNLQQNDTENGTWTEPDYLTALWDDHSQLIRSWSMRSHISVKGFSVQQNWRHERDDSANDPSSKLKHWNSLGVDLIHLRSY